jgi:D-sedoheptulose 7-phosphate isomerase
MGMMAVMKSATPATDADLAFLGEGVAARCAAGDAYFATVARDLAQCAAQMADLFFAGGTLLVFGSGAGATDAQHNSVEYVHPVLPGCRALPALSLTNDISTVTALLRGADPLDVYAHQLRALGRPGDIALAFLASPDDGASLRGLRTAGDGGMLTVALCTGEWAGDVPAAHRFNVDAADALVAQELHLATYHMLWELTHIVLNHRGIAGMKR